MFLHKNTVYKCLGDPNAAKLEAERLRQLQQKGVRVPRVYHQLGRVIAMEYIEGLTLPDYLPHIDEAQTESLARSLVNWLSEYYSAVDHFGTREIRSDVNGRNFIIAQSGVWGVDFEDECFGDIAEDAGKLVAYVKSYDLPEPSAKHALARMLVEAFINLMGLSEKSINTEYERELIAMKKRRAVKTN